MYSATTAFTEIWVGSQQKPSQPKTSRLQEFSVALEAYFEKDSSKKKSDINSEAIKELEPSKVGSSFLMVHIF